MIRKVTHTRLTIRRRQSHVVSTFYRSHTHTDTVTGRIYVIRMCTRNSYVRTLYINTLNENESSWWNGYDRWKKKNHLSLSLSLSLSLLSLLSLFSSLLSLSFPFDCFLYFGGDKKGGKGCCAFDFIFFFSKNRFDGCCSENFLEGEKEHKAR